MEYDVIIIGAGAAGLMCAIESGKRGRKVLLLDHAKSVGEKIRISGGGRCNFTNMHATPDDYLSKNPYFCVSALKRYTQYDFIDLVEKYNIAYHEKTLGQLFCDGSAKQIINMLVSECESVGVEILVNKEVKNISKTDEGFSIDITGANEKQSSTSVVIATGGPSIPKMGSTGWGYDIAKKFGLNIISPQAALVPFTLDKQTISDPKILSGISLEVIASCNNRSFREGLLFTHRGLSGPAILQISSYWNKGDIVSINFAPDLDMIAELKRMKDTLPKQEIQKYLTTILPKRLAVNICERYNYKGNFADLSNKQIQKIADSINKWEIIPNGTEGYNKAEVTIGGVDTNELSSKTFEAKKVQGLYFIGEVVDVTGHLGGFNFQWAWSSGHAAGQYT